MESTAADTVFHLLRTKEPSLAGASFRLFCLKELIGMYHDKLVSAKLLAETLVLVERYC